MLKTVKTFFAHILNSEDLETVLLNPYDSSSANTIFIDQAEADSQDSGTYTVNKQTKVLSVRIKNFADRYALIAQLKTWFLRGTRGPLVCRFKDDGIDYQLDCRVVSLIPDPNDHLLFRVLLETGNSTWRAVDPDIEATWVVTGTSETLDIDVGGTDETFLSLGITAKDGPATGYLYQNLYRLPNKPGFADCMIAWCITVDTATLIAAGKMQADCDDLRIVNLRTGEELKRWIINPNNAATKVWIILDLKKGFALTLATTVASSGLPPYLQFTVNKDTQKKIGEMENSGVVYRNNEWFAYRGKDRKNCRLKLTKRGLFGTTEEGHTAGVTFNYIQYPLLMKYGNSSATSPALTDESYDDTKPLINLTSSDNGTWVWDATSLFADPAHPNRTCAWKFNITSKGPKSKYFHVKQDAETGDPALGLKVASYQVGNAWKDETVTITATFNRNATFTTVSMTGDKYRSNATFLVQAALRRSANNLDYFNLWTENTPALVATHTAWTHNAVSVAAGTKYLQLIFSGGYKGAANAFAIFEALTCTTVFTSGNIPTGTFLGETAAYPLVLTAENITDDEYDDAISLDYPMLIDKTFELDGELRTATYDTVNAHSAVTFDDESRSAFIRLKGGVTNTIRISGADLGELDVVASYYRRRL